MSKVETEIKRVNGYLKEVITFFDSSGKPMSQIVNPLMTELKLRDVLQIFVGSFLVATPLCFTEEVWQLSISLKRENVFALGFISLLVSALFIYFNFYRYRLRGNVAEFIKRFIATYVISISSVVLILLLIDKFPIAVTPYIAIKRVLIIGFPTIFAAVIADYLK